MASRNTSSQAADARARARQMQADQQRRARRNRTFAIWGGVLALAVIVALVIAAVLNRQTGEIPEAGPMPAVANEEGGVTLTSASALADGAGEREVDSASVPEPSQDGEASQPESIAGLEAPAEGEPAEIVLYVDFNCVHCFEFEQANAEQLKAWADSGEATVEYRVVDFLSSPGNKNYSARAANAAYCVADEKPEAYASFVTDLFHAYEGHAGKGLSDEEIAQRAEAAGVDVKDCMTDDTYRPAVAYTTKKAQAAGVRGTPTVMVNGKNWAVDGAEESFQDWARSMIEG